MSLSDYVGQELTRVAHLPTLSEVTDAVRRRGSVEPSMSASAILRAERDATP
jgi:hypothetical protein